MVLFFLDEIQFNKQRELFMSKFYNALSTVAASTILGFGLINLGSIFAPNVVTTESNIIEYATVAQKNVNSLAYYSASTILKQNTSEFAQATFAGLFAFTILGCETGVILLALLILSKKYA
jgi:hypothetical protein